MPDASATFVLDRPVDEVVATLDSTEASLYRRTLVDALLAASAPAGRGKASRPKRSSPGPISTTPAPSAGGETTPSSGP